MTGPSTANPAAAEAVFAPAERAVVDALPSGDVVADIGPGSGTTTVRLAERASRVYAVDNDEAMLALVRQRAEQAGLGDRVHTVLHDLDDGPVPLPEPVSLIWSGACVHHALSWQDAVSGLAGLLEPGGVLALGEGGLPARCLPWDAGVGRPGLEARLDAAHNEWFTGWFNGRPDVVREPRGWPDLLRSGVHSRFLPERIAPRGTACLTARRRCGSAITAIWRCSPPEPSTWERSEATAGDWQTETRGLWSTVDAKSVHGRSAVSGIPGRPFGRVTCRGAG